MKLHGRNLSLNLRGRDVALLHRELRQLGHAIPEDEVSRFIFGRGTLRAVMDFQRKNGLEANGVVDEKTAAVINRDVDLETPRKINGLVTDEKRNPLPGLSVSAVDKDLRREETLGQAVTTRDGRYQINYNARQFRRAEKDSADLILRVMSGDKVLATSDVIFNARPAETIDFRIETTEGRVPEFERYLTTLRPILEDLLPATLTDEDIQFITGETGIPEIHVGYLVVAHQQAQATRTNPELFYGLFRQELPTDLTALVVRPTAEIRQALETSIAEAIINRNLLGEIDRFLAALQGQRALTLAATVSTDQNTNGIGQILRTSGLSAAEQETFLTSYLQHSGPIENFWQSLESTPLAPRVRSIQETLQLDLITQHNAPLLENLRSRNIRSARDLPKIASQELQQTIATSDNILAAIPSLNGDETNEQKAKRYVDEIYKTLEATVPTAVLKASYDRSADPLHKDVARVLSNRPDLDLVDVPLNRFLDENPQVLAGVSDTEAVKTHLKQTQRVMRVARNADHAQALMAEGLNSAHAIANLSQDAFVEQFADRLGGPEQARSYHDRASQVNDSVLGVVASIKHGMTAVNPSVMNPRPVVVKDLPNFTTLFGSQSLCACSDCNSVLSPAAYLVDLLQMINPKSGPKPIQRLRLRRPDIEHISLSCDNTNTELPYIDLVNEILEFYLGHNQTLSPQAAHDTQGTTAQELSINPQFVVIAAYEALAAAVYPFALPFNRPLAISRLYLTHLGAPRHQVMNTFRKGGQPTEAEIDLEGLEISDFEARILRGNLNNPLADFYGNGGNPGNLSQINVAEFLRRTGISYEDLTELLTIQTLNPAASIKLEDSDNPPRCNPEKIMITSLTPAFWQNAHRIIRLSKKIGWSFADLDIAFRSLNETQITQQFLRKLSSIKQLKAELKLSLPVLFSFWSDLDVERPESLYSQLFRNKAVVNPLDSAFSLAALSNSSALIKDHAPTICAALRIGVDDLEAICQHVNLPSDQTTLSLTRLSALHRHANLARALKLKVNELLSLLTLSDKNPFLSSDPASTESFLEIAKLVKDSGFKISELNYVYRHLSDPKSPLSMSDDAVNELINAIHAGLKGVLDPATESADLTVDPLRPPLVKVVGEDLVDRAIDVVYGTPDLTEAQRAEFINNHLTAFLNPAEAQALFFNPATTQVQKQDYIRARVSEFEGKGAVTQVLSDSLKLESGTVAILVERIVKSKVDPSQSSLNDFLSLSSVPVEVIKAEAPPDPAAQTILQNARKGVVHLHKISILLERFKMGERELDHLSRHADDFGDFDLNALPVEETAFNAALFADWLRLASFTRLARIIPQSDSDLITVFAAAYLPSEENPHEKAIEELKKATAWEPKEVDFLVSANGLDLASADDFKNDSKLHALKACIGLSKRLGVSCERLFEWSSSSPTQEIANQIVAAAKAKYSQEQWLVVAKPLNDTLREAQKRALLSAILTSEKSKNLGLTDSNKLFEHFLIDVEMSACGKTSRIKQAISSVQLFIERCLMNMEPGVNPSAIDADHWEWMKNYRVWEANRKIFLYPENWIEPELRDDKSPFFKQLETELLQNDLTLETAEQAFVHYLERLDEVSHLEICGLYNQKAEHGEDEVTHVFGRTKAQPHAYYYRRLIDNRTWTAWEKLETDIEGDHIFPVVHNRRLYLFWLQFTEVQNEKQELPAAYLQSLEHWRWLTEDHPHWVQNRQDWLREHDIRAIWKSIESLLAVLKEVAVQEELKNQLLDAFITKYGIDPTIEERPEPREPEEPPFTVLPVLTHWEIKLAWSEYQYGRWSAKKVSTESVTSSSVAKSLQDFFWEEGGLGGLILLGLLNQAHQLLRMKEDGTFEETIFNVFLPSKDSHFVRTSVSNSGNLVVRIYRRYSHSASVLKLLDLTIKGHESVGKFSLRCGNKVQASIVVDQKDYDSLARPDGSTNSSTYFMNSNASKLTFKSEGKSRQILEKVPANKYSILGLHQKEEFRLKPPYQDFFYQDQGKAYYVTYQAQAIERTVANLGRSLLNGSWSKDTPMIESLKKRSAVTTRSLSSGSSRTIVKVQNSANVSRVEDDNDSFNSFQLSKSKLTAESVQDNFLGALSFADEGLKFTTYFHPHICEFVERLYEEGVGGLLKRSTQQLDNDKNGSVFAAMYDPSGEVAFPYPKEDVDFDNGPYALYNWELFFHIPMFIALSLCKNQRFDEAVQWFHFVFNPTTSEVVGAGVKPLQRFWTTLPFYENTDPEKDQIQELLLTLAGKKSGWQKIEQQIEDWRNDPFNPHLIARMRITAYQKNVVMKYIENLIAWADQLFTRDTLEAINEATLLYVLAGNILGPRPKVFPRSIPAASKTYNEISSELDAFSNLLLEVENELPVFAYKKSLSWSAQSNKSLKLKRGNPSRGSSLQSSVKITALRPSLKVAPVGPVGASAVRALHFCVPDNENMLACWDTVADRLFKIRHCMNIEGVVRELPLFEPPIDPALLVRARAAGVDLSSVMNDLFAPLPRYRYGVLVQKALELCNELKSLGGALLSALEKKDSEELSNLRARQETGLLSLTRQVKQLQIDEQKANIVALNKTRAVTESRYSHYRDIAELNTHEREQMGQLETAHDVNMVAQGIAAGASAAHLVPDFSAGTSGAWSSPVTVASYGGSNVGSGIQAAATVVGMFAAIHSHQASQASIKGGYDRRWEEWKLQEKLASLELTQIDQQIIAAEIRQVITEQELLSHDRQLENSLEVEELLRTKYTNEDLYSWMISQISKVYFQTYNLAYDLSKRTERAYRFELGLSDSSFIQFGYWDSLKKGLLAGEQLELDLKRMDAAYLDQNKRDYEITRHVSLMLHDPMALIALKETGKCILKLPESFFDADYPGHYMRRIKSVSLTIPCVVGPYTSINCTLTLLNNRARITSTPAQPYHQTPNDIDDNRFILNFAAQQSIATSNAQNDAGLFELDFQDNRYLPFEGAGAISEWQIDLPSRTNAFDFATISDVILHLKYTSREGGESLRNAAWEERQQLISDAASSPLTRLFSLKTEFPADWHRFLHPNEPATEQEYLHKLNLELTMERFPFLFRGEQLELNNLTVCLKLKDGFAYEDGSMLSLELNQLVVELQKQGSPAGAMPSVTRPLNGASVPFPVEIGVAESSLPSTSPNETSWWEVVEINNQEHVRLKAKAIEDVWLICGYSLAL